MQRKNEKFDCNLEEHTKLSHYITELEYTETKLKIHSL